MFPPPSQKKLAPKEISKKNIFPQMLSNKKIITFTKLIYTELNTKAKHILFISFLN